MTERDLRFGTTCQAHIDQVLLRVSSEFGTVMACVHGLSRRLKPVEREVLSRRLAGVIADCESIRLWLDAGAPK